MSDRVPIVRNVLEAAALASRARAGTEPRPRADILDDLETRLFYRCTGGLALGLDRYCDHTAGLETAAFWLPQDPLRLICGRCLANAMAPPFCVHCQEISHPSRLIRTAFSCGPATAVAHLCATCTAPDEPTDGSAA